MHRATDPRAAFVVLTALLTGCGGGGDAAPAGAGSAAAAATAVTTTDNSAAASAVATTDTATATTASASVAAPARIAAATATAQSAANACNAIRPFYWEIGDRQAKAAGGSVDGAAAGVGFSASTVVSIASASKWIYSAYVVQKRGGAPTDRDRKFLTLQSGYAGLQNCDPAQTVDACLAAQPGAGYAAAADGKFDYGGGHMQKHASLDGLGPMNAAALSAEVRSQIGSDVPLAYSLAQPAGGLVMTADGYARFLRKLLTGELALGAVLGSGAVCTNPRHCANAVYTPVPLTESWHYALGHWVEDDPVVGDGAFSSAGSFGFYPWIDAAKSSYGVISRSAQAGSGYASAQCGRLLRKAWATGVAQ